MARSPPISTSEEDDVVSTSAVMDALSDGAVRIVGTGQLTVSDNLNILLENPSGSGVNATLFGVIAANSTSSVTFPTLHTNPTTDLPTTQRTAFDTNLGTDNTVAINLYADDMASEMSGGDDTIPFGTEGGRTEMQAFFAIPPGTSLGLSNPFSGLTSADASFTGWLIEEPL